MAYPGYSGAPVPPPRRSLVAPLLVLALLVVLLVAYLLVGVATRAQWMGSGSQDGTKVTFAVRATDGSAPSPDALSRTRDMVAARASELGLPGARVTAEGDTLAVTAPGDGADIEDIARTGRLVIRPVIHAIPTESGPTASSDPEPPAPGLESRIDEERQLRQSTDTQIQLLALQFQASRCAGNDDLAGRDDPNLPLITCSRDNSEVYLLDKAIITGEQIEGAEAHADEQRGEPVVDLEFTGDGTKIWADFTADHVGSRTAFVVDTEVVSAPEIMAAIPGGRTQITGQFTDADARALASVLDDEPLPARLTAESSTPETVAGQPASVPLRIGLVGVGAVLAAALVGTVGWLARRARRRGAAPGTFG